MKRFFVLLLAAGIVSGISAQDNMEAFRHLSIGAEVGLHGLGVEVAMPVQKHLVLKAGYNWVPSGDLFTTDLTLDTKELRDAQNTIESNHLHTFTNKFGETSVINAGLQLGMTNYKVMLNWYPFVAGRFYVSGGVYYTPSSKQNDPFIKISGKTTANDWAALQELNDVEHQYNPAAGKRELALTIGDKNYAVKDVDGCGYMQADFTMDPLKYYVGLGIGRCVPNNLVGLQFELGAMIYHNAKLYCQDQEVGSISDAAAEFGNDAKEIIEYVDKYPIYPQVSLRLSFRMF